MTRRATRTVTRLFEAYAGDADRMSADFASAAAAAGAEGDESARLRVVTDYIAGMTDRFALQEYERLFPAD